MEYFDTHAHYTDERFDEDREALLASLPEQGVTLALDCACTESEWAPVTALAERHPSVYFALGVHGLNAHEVTEGWLGRLRPLLSHPKCVAIGEIGLDYHYDFAPRSLQKEVLQAQLELAAELDLPVILHDREAHADMLALLTPFAGRLRGVLHCYSGSAEMVREFSALGLYFGFGGSLTFKNNEKGKLAAQAVPLDRLLIETDCPYLAPVPFRGKRNDSTLVRWPCQLLAQLRGMSEEEMAALTMENGKRLFFPQDR